jgi:hypothetical protein
MSDGQSAGALKQAIEDILKLAPSGSRTRSIRSAEAYIRDVVELDYNAAVSKHFSGPQLTRMFREVRKTLPTLNQEVYRIKDVRRLTRKAAALGVVLRADAYNGSDATGLRGFYVKKAERLTRPLIWVNSATHPVVTAASFWHEVGHHLTGPIFGNRRQRVHLSLGPDYRDDMADPEEIAADMVRVMAGYPQPVAQRLFGGSDMEALSYDADLLVSKVRPYVRAKMGLDFDRRFSPKENLYYLRGMIYVAKLRSTLLSEYGI